MTESEEKTIMGKRIKIAVITGIMLGAGSLTTVYAAQKATTITSVEKQISTNEDKNSVVDKSIGYSSEKDDSLNEGNINEDENKDISINDSDKETDVKDKNSNQSENISEPVKRTGWYKNEENNLWYYYNADNNMIKNNWLNSNGKWYYFNSDGVMVTGINMKNGKNYYFNDYGYMQTGWIKSNENWYYFLESGEMKYGWFKENNKYYYLDGNNGVMLKNVDRYIDGKNYRFNNDGSMAQNTWHSDGKYSNYNGECVEVSSLYANSAVNYEILKYMTDYNNQISVHNEAIRLHGGIDNNNCVYFLSEVLRRNGMNIPRSTANVSQMENQLRANGFKVYYDLNYLQPGDIVVTKNQSHVYIFMCWADGWNAYIADNQKKKFYDVVHKRDVKDYDSCYDTDPSVRFYRK